MKFKYILFTLPLAFMFSCDEDSDDIPAPIVNVNEESKGSTISFSAPDLTYYDTSEDTFVVISGGIPPYIVESSSVPYILKEDTLFFSVRTNSFVETKRVNVIDNRGYNRAQFTFLTGPSFLNYDVFDGNTGSNFISAIGLDSSGNNIGFFFQRASNCFYAPKTKQFFIRFVNEDDLTVDINLSNNNTTPDSIYFDDDFNFYNNSVITLFDGDFEMDGTNSSVNMSYDIFGFPTSVKMNLFVKRKGTNNNKLNLKVGPLTLQ